MTSKLPLEQRREKLQALALESIHAGTEWLSAEQLRALGSISASASGENQLTANELLFWIQLDGHDVCPRYAFGEDLTPLPIMRDILAKFDGWSPLLIAAWFESTSSFLDGKRPRELIVTDPALVLDAANDAVMALSY